MEIYTMLAVPIEVILVAWKMDKASFKTLKLEILLVSLLFFNISEEFKIMMVILIRRVRMAITTSNSIRVKALIFLERILSFSFLK